MVKDNSKSSPVLASLREELKGCNRHVHGMDYIFQLFPVLTLPNGFLLWELVNW